MKLRILFFVFLLACRRLFRAALTVRRVRYKIRIGFPLLAFSYMPFYVAQEKGIYKKYSIESEYIQMGTTIQPASRGRRQHQLLHLGLDGNFRGGRRIAFGHRDQLLRQLALGAGHTKGHQQAAGSDRQNRRALGHPHLAVLFLSGVFEKIEINDKGRQHHQHRRHGGQLSRVDTQPASSRTVLTPPFDDKAVSLGYKKFMQLGDLADIPYVGLVTSQDEIKTNRESVRRTVAAVMESLAWLRTNRAESTKMIVDKFKVNQQEAENTYATLIRLLNKDGRLNPKVARGYLDILRQERPIPADFDLQKAVDFSLLPASR